MNLNLILCPACGWHESDPAIGTGRICVQCGHVFQVVNNQAQNFEDDDDDDDDDHPPPA